MANVRKCRETFLDYNFFENFYRIFLTPDMDSTGDRVPYRIFLGQNWKIFDPSNFSKGVPLLGELRDFVGDHNFLWDLWNWMGFALQNRIKN
ncbi:unnamed protein product [Meloidogyne enterolobii]|uniref:Uncharacterized protein n=1 Tax=Meloidogyne enterolobii TaxID=390850 RepID=A0ACB0Z628_MELEN